MCELIPSFYHLVNDNSPSDLPNLSNVEKTIRLIKPIRDTVKNTGPVEANSVVKRIYYWNRIFKLKFFRPVFPGIQDVLHLMNNQIKIPKSWFSEFQTGTAFPGIIFAGSQFFNPHTGSYFYPKLYSNRVHNNWELHFEELIPKQKELKEYWGNEKRIAVYV